MKPCFVTLRTFSRSTAGQALNQLNSEIIICRDPDPGFFDL